MNYHTHLTGFFHPCLDLFPLVLSVGWDIDAISGVNCANGEDGEKLCALQYCNNGILAYGKGKEKKRISKNFHSILGKWFPEFPDS